MTHTHTLSSVKQIEEEITTVRALMSDVEDIDEIVELDEKLDILYRALETIKNKELYEALQNRGGNSSND